MSVWQRCTPARISATMRISVVSLTPRPPCYYLETTANQNRIPSKGQPALIGTRAGALTAPSELTDCSRQTPYGLAKGRGVSDMTTTPNTRLRSRHRARLSGAPGGIFRFPPRRCFDTRLILGQTGVGKTTFLLNLLAQLTEQGAGIAFLDPHGDAVESNSWSSSHDAARATWCT